MTNRKWLDYSTQVPGPGAHRVSYKLVEKNEGAIVFKQSKAAEDKPSSPGPGKYDIVEK
jgi:hypothetical protein